MTNQTTIDLGGVIVPLLTPLTAEGNVDIASLQKLVRHCIDAGAGAVCAGGSAGAGPLLLESQWEEMVATVVEAAKGKVPVLAGIIATSTARALEQI